MQFQKIKPNPDNPRLITDDRFNMLVESLRTFPQMLAKRPIVIDEHDIALGGNQRYKAIETIIKTPADQDHSIWSSIRSSGGDLPKEWVSIAKGWTDEEKREFVIKDNVSFGEMDWEKIARDWDVHQLVEWGVDFPADFEFGSMPSLGEGKAAEDDFELPPIEQVQTDIELGDLLTIGRHRLMCGDSRSFETWERLMNGMLADLNVTDPPYNVDYEGGTGLKIMNDKMSNSSFLDFLRDAFTAGVEHTKPGGAWYVWHADSEGLNFRMAFANSGLMLKQCLIWVKNSLVMGRQDYQWKHEPCLYGWKPGAAHYFTDDRTKTTVIQEDVVDFNSLKKPELIKLLKELTREKEITTVMHVDKPFKSIEHPTMKPVLLIAPLISNSSRPGEIVTDGFLGSGTTMVAAEQLNRKCYGIENDPRYCQVIIDRMTKLNPNIEVINHRRA